MDLSITKLVSLVEHQVLIECTDALAMHSLSLVTNDSFDTEFHYNTHIHAFYILIAMWLAYDYLMISLRLPYDDPTITLWRSYDYFMTILWLTCNHPNYKGDQKHWFNYKTCDFRESGRVIIRESESITGVWKYCDTEM